MDQSVEITPTFQHALDLMERSGRHCLITGKAGTGKSTLLQYFRDHTQRRVAVLAPTGVAAVNIGGQTIHSFFRFRTDITPARAHKAGQQAHRRGDKLYRGLDTVVFDEISMVRADLFDCVDRFLRAARAQPNHPFGGVQIVMVGDLYQLPPVVKSTERDVFTTAYPGPYFFNAPVFAQLAVEMIELEKVYRQRDQGFIRLLNTVRNNSITTKDVAAFNTRYLPDFISKGKSYITLTATNDAAASINAEHLRTLRGKACAFSAEVSGDFPVDLCPTDRELALKVGAQVMLLNNDGLGRWVNGTLGTITAIQAKRDTIVVALETGDAVEVAPHTWEMYRYTFDAKQKTLDTEAIGSFTQYPLRLAWAVTIHKSQGKTFDRVIIDVGRGTFASGQMYVALSRCRTLEGLVLRHRLLPQHIRVDWRIVKFLTQFQYARSETAMPLAEKLRHLAAAIAHRQAVSLTYLKSSDVRSERTVEPLEIGEMEYKGYTFLGLRAHCRERRDERVFRVDRILKLEVVE